MDRATKRRDRRPLERILPSSILAEIRSLMASQVEPTASVARELEDRFNLQGRFGVTQRRVLHFLRRLSVQTEETKACSATRGRHQDVHSSEGIRNHRERQGSIAAILESCFGGPAASRPELWEQRAYLMLIGLVYERLATSEAEIASAELSTLAKVLVDARRALGERKTTDEKSGSSVSADRPRGTLPCSFRDAVRQVYGTELPKGAVEQEKNEAGE